jgi:hypothetical protein
VKVEVVVEAPTGARSTIVVQAASVAASSISGAIRRIASPSHRPCGVAVRDGLLQRHPYHPESPHGCPRGKPCLAATWFIFR